MDSCTACGAGDQPQGARFCFSCGAPLTAPTCATCGEPVKPGARFCSECGAPQGPHGTEPAGAPVASRRVTSVLFGDLVGFTSLSESRDQEEVRELLSRYFEECRTVVARYGGTVEKFIGDAVMAVWGVPTAHEDDAERAVRAGLELVAAVTSLGEEVGVPDLAMRVGVVTGEVAVTVGASHQGMVAGDAVNTAARVQAAASPGQVWVDESTRLLTSSAITFVDVGSHVMKGKADPVPLWSVRAVVAAMGGAQRADGLEAPLVGRERELRLCKELFHSSQESGRPLLLVVDGDPGTGKTRLVWEFEKYTDGLTGSVLWHHGRCLAYGEGVAFFALAEAVRGRLRSLYDGEVPDDEAPVLERGMSELVPDDAERAWLHPRVGALLGIGSVGAYPREDLFSAWATFFERVSADGDPVVLVVDDAQHADEGLLLFVEHLLATAAFPCFVVLLARPGLLEERPALAVNRRATVVHLDSLSDLDMGTLVSGLVSGLPDDVRDQLVARSEGVPLFAVETVRSLIDRDLVVPRGGQYVLADRDDLDLSALGAPASLQALVAARLDTLSEYQSRVVDRASVLGASFSRGAVEVLCADVEDVAGVLDTLVRVQILAHETRRFSADFGQYQFVQSVVRQVAYGRLSRRDRKATHLAVVAQILDGSDTADVAAIVAQHYLDAVEAVPTDPDAVELSRLAVDALERAAARAALLGGPNEAVGHLTTALTLETDPARVAALEGSLASALNQAGRYAESVDHAGRAVEMFVEVGNRVAAAGAAVSQSEALNAGLRDNERAVAVLQDWWEELKDHPGEAEARFRVCTALVSARSRMGFNDRDLMEVQVKLAERTGSASNLAKAFVSFGIYFSASGSVALGRLLIEAAAVLARENHEPEALARTLNNLAADYALDDLDRAIEAGREGVAVATTAGLSIWRSYAACNLAMSLYLRGDWDELDRGLVGADPVPGDTNDIVFWCVDDLLAWVRGQRPATLDQRREVFTGDDPADEAWVTMLAAFTAARSGDPAAASLAVEATEMHYRLNGVWDDLPFFWAIASDLALASEDAPLLARLEAMAEAGEQIGLLPLNLRAFRARVVGVQRAAQGDPAGAEPLLRAAIEDFRAWGALPSRARAELDLSACLRALGRPEEADDLEVAAGAVLAPLRAVAWLQPSPHLSDTHGAGDGAR